MFVSCFHFSSSQAQTQLRFRPWTKRWLSLHTNCLDVLLGFSSEMTPLEGPVEHPALHSQVLHGAALPLLPPCPLLLAHSLLGDTDSPLGTGTDGAEASRGAMPCAVFLLSLHCCSALESSFSSPVEHVCRFDCQTATYQAFWRPEFFNATY